MKSKDQTLLEEAYGKVVEGTTNRVEYFEETTYKDVDEAGNTVGERLARPDIILDRCRYKWDPVESSYFGNEGSCGTYGAVMGGGKWIPAWIPEDSSDIQLGDESFSDPQSAIEAALSSFS